MDDQSRAEKNERLSISSNENKTKVGNLLLGGRVKLTNMQIRKDTM